MTGRRIARGAFLPIPGFVVRPTERLDGDLRIGARCKQHCLAAREQLRRAWLVSPFSSLVSGPGAPPASDTCWIGEPPLGVKVIVPPLLQLAPRELTKRPRVNAAPPLTEIFFRLPAAKNPIHCPSGEKKGLLAPSVPAWPSFQAIHRPQINLPRAASNSHIGELSSVG